MKIIFHSVLRYKMNQKLLLRDDRFIFYRIVSLTGKAAISVSQDPLSVFVLLAA